MSLKSFPSRLFRPASLLTLAFSAFLALGGCGGEDGGEGENDGTGDAPCYERATSLCPQGCKARANDTSLMVVTYPNGGEVLKIDSTYTLTYCVRDSSQLDETCLDTADPQVSLDGGMTWYSLPPTGRDSTSISFFIPDSLTGEGGAKVSSVSNKVRFSISPYDQCAVKDKSYYWDISDANSSIRR